MLFNKIVDLYRKWLNYLPLVISVPFERLIQYSLRILKNSVKPVTFWIPLAIADMKYFLYYSLQVAKNFRAWLSYTFKRRSHIAKVTLNMTKHITIVLLNLAQRITKVLFNCVLEISEVLLKYTLEITNLVLSCIPWTSKVKVKRCYFKLPLYVIFFLNRKIPVWSSFAKVSAINAFSCVAKAMIKVYENKTLVIKAICRVAVVFNELLQMVDWNTYYVKYIVKFIFNQKLYEKLHEKFFFKFQEFLKKNFSFFIPHYPLIPLIKILRLDPLSMYYLCHTLFTGHVNFYFVTLPMWKRKIFSYLKYECRDFILFYKYKITMFFLHRVVIFVKKVDDFILNGIAKFFFIIDYKGKVKRIAFRCAYSIPIRFLGWFIEVAILYLDDKWISLYWWIQFELDYETIPDFGTPIYFILYSSFLLPFFLRYYIDALWD